MTYRTQGEFSLWADVIAGLEGEGFAFDPLTTTLPEYLATALGEPNAHKTKSVPQMLAEIDAMFGGSLSELSSSVARLLSALDGDIGAGGGGESFPPVGAVIAAAFVDGDYYANGQVRTQAQFLTLNDATIEAGGLSVDDLVAPNLGADALASLNLLLAGGFTVVIDGITGAVDSWLGLMGVYPELDPGTSAVAVEVYGSAIDATVTIDDWNELGPDTLNSVIAESRNRLAFTVMRNVGGGVYRTSLSLNGDVIATQDTAYGLDTHLVEILYASFGGVFDASNAEGLITDFIVYPAVAESELPTLSALS